MKGEPTVLTKDPLLMNPTMARAIVDAHKKGEYLEQPVSVYESARDIANAQAEAKIEQEDRTAIILPGDEDLAFKTSINFNDIEVQKSFRGEVEYLNSAKSEIGEISLDNNGMFTQVFKLPNFVGCINLKDGVSAENSAIRNYQFQINFLQEGVTLHGKKLVEIPIGKTETYDLIGEYASYNVPASAFSSGNIQGISIYDLKDGATNPLRASYRYNRHRLNKDNCNDIRTTLDPVTTISLV